MKILIAAFHLNEVNGYSLVIRKQAICLREKGHEVLILTNKLPKDFLNGEDKHNFLSYSVLDNLYISKIFKKLNEFLPHIVHLHGMSISDYHALNYAKKNNIPVVTTIHTKYMSLIEEILPMGKYWHKFFKDKLIDFIVSRQSYTNTFIALSEEMKSYMSSIGMKNIEICSNGVDLDLFDFKERSIDKEEINLAYVGNIERRKNQTYLLKVLEYLPQNYNLTLIGGESWDKIFYNEFKLKLKFVDKRVKFLGKLNQSEIIKELNYNDIFVSASLMEAQSLVLLESISVGLPIFRLVSNSTLGITEHGKTGYHVDENFTPENFAKELIKFVENKELYKTINSNYKVERENYSWSSTCDRLVEIYEKVLNLS